MSEIAAPVVRLARPLEEARRIASAALPPPEIGPLRQPDLVELAALADFTFDLRYTTTDNFMGAPLYRSARPLLQRPAAEALAAVQQDLAPQGLGLVIYDAYRPWHVTKMMWEAVEPEQRAFVANPAKGSRHNRGCAVDVGLVARSTGRVVEMPSAYDEFSPRSYADYPGGPEHLRSNREVLRRAMRRRGFTVYETEWWHFDHHTWPYYPILNREG